MIRGPASSAMANPQRRGLVAGLLAAVFFGLSAPLISVISGEASPLMIAALLYAGAALALLVVANNLFNISGSMVLGSHADQVFETGFGGAAGLIAFNVVFTLLVILFAEILPKTIGNSFAMPISLVASRVLLVAGHCSGRQAEGLNPVPDA